MENTTTKITRKSIDQFAKWLAAEDRSEGTISKYVHDVRSFAKWNTSSEVSKESITGWKEYLVNSDYSPATINSMLAAMNTYCRFAGLNCKVRFLRIQRKMFCDESRELTKAEYERLIDTALKRGKQRIAMIIETIGATGIRVSELQYITVEAARSGKTQISLKGKIRTIFLPGKLCRKLIKYAKANKIASGELFVTRSGKSITRKQVWSDMKNLCAEAGIAESKVFPHNLRHLFAKIFYNFTKDIAKLADILGHSSIETTRIYLLTNGNEHARQLEKLCLVR